jgi:hypothetical protein
MRLIFFLEHSFDSFTSLKLQSFGNENIVNCVKSEGMSMEEVKPKENSDSAGVNSICYPDLSEDCIHGSTLCSQGEGDYQPPYVREAKAFHDLEAEGVNGHDKMCEDSPLSSAGTSYTDELIAQLHTDINNISFDNIHLSDSEVEKEIQTVERNCEERKPTDCCSELNINSNTISFDMEIPTDQENLELRHSPKFSQLDNLLNQYFTVKRSSEEGENGEEQEISPRSEGGCSCILARTRDRNNNPFACTNVNSTIALSADCEFQEFTQADIARMFSRSDIGKESSEWVEANEVQIRITEPGCSKDFLQGNGQDDDVNAVQTREYWSNVGLIKEHTVDRRYMGPVEIPGIEMIKGVARVQEKSLTDEPEAIIWATEAEALEKKSPSSSQEGGVNYLSFPEKAEGIKKKKKFVNKLTRAISGIFKFNNTKD